MSVKVKFISQLVQFDGIFKRHGIYGLPNAHVVDELEFEYATLDNAIVAFRDFHSASIPKANKMIASGTNAEHKLCNGFHSYVVFRGTRKPRGYDKSELTQRKDHKL